MHRDALSVAQSCSHELRHPKVQMLNAAYTVQGNERCSRYNHLGLNLMHRFHGHELCIAFSCDLSHGIFRMGRDRAANRQRDEFEASLKSKTTGGHVAVRPKLLVR